MDLSALFDRESLKNTFRRHCYQIVEIARTASIELAPFTDGLAAFSRLEYSAQLESLEKIKKYNEILEASIASGSSICDDSKLIWFALQKFQLRPPSNLFEHIKPGYVIEIHDFSGIQLFRNFKFFTFCSYSLEEIFCRPWPELFFHSVGATEKLLSIFNQFKRGSIRNAITLDVPSHKILENFSLKRNLIYADFHVAAPLFNSSTGEPAASLIIESGKLLGSFPKLTLT